jgi:hypothetical protein
MQYEKEQNARNRSGDRKKKETEESLETQGCVHRANTVTPDVVEVALRYESVCVLSRLYLCFDDARRDGIVLDELDQPHEEATVVHVRRRRIAADVESLQGRVLADEAAQCADGGRKGCTGEAQQASSTSHENDMRMRDTPTHGTHMHDTKKIADVWTSCACTSRLRAVVPSSSSGLTSGERPSSATSSSMSTILECLTFFFSTMPRSTFTYPYIVTVRRILGTRETGSAEVDTCTHE